MTNDITSLIEIFLKPGQDHPVLYDFPKQLDDPHQEYYKHILIDDENVLWYFYMSTKPIEDELDAPILLHRLAAIDLNNLKEVDFVLTTHPIASRKLAEGTTAQLVGFDELLSSSNGYILYKWQAEVIYRTYTLCSAEEATQWVKDWNKKKPAARTTNFEIEGQPSMLEIFSSGCYDRLNQFFYSAQQR